MPLLPHAASVAPSPKREGAINHQSVEHHLRLSITGFPSLLGAGLSLGASPNSVEWGTVSPNSS